MPIDQEPPIVSNCVSDFSVQIPAGSTQGMVTWTEPTATDNSGIQPVVSRSHFPGATFGLGPTTVSYTFTDQAGNSASCVFTVTVNGKYLFVLFE